VGSSGGVALAASPNGAVAQTDVSLPGLSSPTPRGTGQFVRLHRLRPARKGVDGRVSDWRGQPSGFAGTPIYSRAELVYQYRLYTFLAAEHQTPGVFDEWAEAARYLSRFRRDPHPAEVRFARDMALEREIELGTAKKPNPSVRFDFGSA
jgi:hypothetical protein